jgi:hypothetical protein
MDSCCSSFEQDAPWASLRQAAMHKSPYRVPVAEPLYARRDGTISAAARAHQKEHTMTTASDSNEASNAAQPLRDPREWKTGDEPITTSQRSYLETLATEAGEPAGDLDSLTKAEAAIRIDALQKKTGRGQPQSS